LYIVEASKVFLYMEFVSADRNEARVSARAAFRQAKTRQGEAFVALLRHLEGGGKILADQGFPLCGKACGHRAGQKRDTAFLAL
jgi:hypothetical protein